MGLGLVLLVVTLGVVGLRIRRNRRRPGLPTI
jgi:hypothetical protein